MPDEAKLAAYVARVVDEAPPLTEDQRARINQLLAPAVDETTSAAIDAYVQSLRIEEWAPLGTAERDLVRRALGPPVDLAAETAAAQRRLEQAVAAEKAAREQAEVTAAAERQKAARRCALYRHFDDAGRLLYVGITRRTDQRRMAHRDGAPWMRFQARETVEWLPDRPSAEAAERAAIAAEQPVFNIHHAAAGARERRMQYLADQGAWDMLREVR